MLSVNERTKEAFLKDSTHKELFIEFEGVELEDINYYIGNNYEHTNGSSIANVTAGTEYSIRSNPQFGKSNVDNSSYMFKYVDDKYYQNFDYLYVSFLSYLRFAKNNSEQANYTANSLKLTVWFGTERKEIEYTDANEIKRLLNAEERIQIPFRAVSLTKKDTLMIQYTIGLTANEDATSISYRVEAMNVMANLSNIEPSDYIYPDYVPSQIVDGKYPKIGKIPAITNEDLIEESLSLTESLCSQDNLKFGLCEASVIKFAVANRKDLFKNNVFRAYIKAADTEKIPLGRFKVRTETKQIEHNLVTKKIIGYDEMEKWSDDASGWYADYMFGISTIGYGDGYEYARQMFATFYNFTHSRGYLKEFDSLPVRIDAYWAGKSVLDQHKTVPLKSYRYNAVEYLPMIPDPQPITDYSTGSLYAFGITYPDKSRLYKFSKVNVDDKTDEQILEELYVKKNHDRGILSKGSVLVEETLNDGSKYKYLVDCDDYFALSSDCNRFMCYYACEVNNITDDGASRTMFVTKSVSISSVPAPDWVLSLVNRSTRLVYYNWKTLEIPALDCTERDVYRSLMEINGAFCRINRQGVFEVMYAQKGGLYPSENLYPADDLFPIKGIDRIARSKYIKATTEDYISQDFGKIQIYSNNMDEEVVALKSYVGNPTLDSTYIIDDNIFYCNGSVIFDKNLFNGSMTQPIEMLPEVEEMLKNMYLRIKSTSYTPHRTEAIGMPWMEVGDRINLMTAQDAFESFIFRRTISGIQFLIDNYEANGNDVISAYKEN